MTPDTIPDGTKVIYHGSLTQYRDQWFWAEWCDCPGDRGPDGYCGGYLLEDRAGGVRILHVRRESITSMEVMA